jgi:two-component system, NtrC family, response regulator AtoC
MESCNIFIVEDNEWYGKMLKHYLSLKPSFQISTFSRGKDFLDQLHNRPDILVIDFSLSVSNAGEIFTAFRNRYPEVPAIIICDNDEVVSIAALLKYDLTSYLIKNEAIQELLWNAVHKINEHQNLLKEIKYLKENARSRFNVNNIIKGNSTAIKKITAIIEKAARTNINVSVTGEIGTGKGLVAKAVHYNSERSKGPFVAVNMAAMSPELMAYELFGYGKDAFKGAFTGRRGKLEEANGGTLCIDNIACMSRDIQIRLLHAVQEKEITGTDGTDKIKLDVRFITTNRTNLAGEVDKGNFNEDLYFRMMGLPVDLPPLRERGFDIILLSGYFLNRFCEENALPPVKLAGDAKDKLLSYHYPGNVSELKTITELAAVMCNGSEIVSDDILFNAGKKELLFPGEEKSLREYNIQIIQHYLHKYNNNVQKVADKLDIGKSTIYKMMQNKEILV